MSGAYEAIIQMLLWLSSSLPGLLLLTSPIWGFLGIRKIRSARRARAFRSFAAAHGFQYIGTAASDVRDPYSGLEDVRQAHTLSNLIEGGWDGLEVSMFEIAPRRRFPRTAVIVRMEADMQPVRRPHAGVHVVSASPHARALLAAGPPAEVDVQGRYLFVGAMRRLVISDLPEFLDFATSIARWVVADAHGGREHRDERG